MIRVSIFLFLLVFIVDLYGESENYSQKGIVLWEDDDKISSFVMGGYLQSWFEYINNDSSMPATSNIDRFSLNKARLSFKGKYQNWASCKIEFDIWDRFTPMSAVEVYGAIKPIQYAEVRFGLIKAPLMTQNFMSGSLHLFAENAMVIKQKVFNADGMDPVDRKSKSFFPSKDVGVMILGNLFPFSELALMKDWPIGIIRYYYAYQNGYDMKHGTGKGTASMHSFRLEANPFGYKGYNESHWNFEDKHLMLSFNLGKNIDIDKSQNSSVDKDAWLIGFDAQAGWQGVALSGGWFSVRSMGSDEYRSQNDSPDPDWQSLGFYVQAAGFIPFKIVTFDLRKHLELKFRFQQFDPYTTLSGSIYTEEEKGEFVPEAIETFYEREARIFTLGFNLYFDLFNQKNRMKLSFDYNIRDEIEAFKDINTLDESGNPLLSNIQLRNDSWILQLQIAL